MIARERQAAVDAFIAKQEQKRKVESEEASRLSKETADKADQDKQEFERKIKLL